jgi:TBC1 domain family member 5
MNGVDDEYFKSTVHHNILLNILFIWVTRHRKTGYRQGMHEIVAPVLLVLQQERQAWTIYLTLSQSADPTSFPKSQQLQAFANCLSEEYLEASTYWIFERIMTELEALYSPVTSADEQPIVVHYCTKIQGTIHV